MKTYSEAQLRTFVSQGGTVRDLAKTLQMPRNYLSTTLRVLGIRVTRPTAKRWILDELAKGPRTMEQILDTSAHNKRALQKVFYEMMKDGLIVNLHGRPKGTREAWGLYALADRT